MPKPRSKMLAVKATRARGVIVPRTPIRIEKSYRPDRRPGDNNASCSRRFHGKHFAAGLWHKTSVGVFGFREPSVRCSLRDDLHFISVLSFYVRTIELDYLCLFDTTRILYF